MDDIVYMMHKFASNFSQMSIALASGRSNAVQRYAEQCTYIWNAILNNDGNNPMTDRHGRRLMSLADMS